MTRHFAIGTILTAALAAGVAAQAPRPSEPAASAAVDPVLAEIRALRADINASNALAIRTQVLVGRLQLQEERVHSLDRELATTRQQLAEIARGRAAMAGPLKMFGQLLETPPQPADPDEVDVFASFRQMAATEQAREQELKEREASLTAQVATEQARWVEFSRQLDEIERSLASRR